MSFDGANGGWLTVGQAANLAGCSPDTVRAWERNGLLSARRTPGGQRRFDEEEVRRFLKLRHRAPQVNPPEPKQSSQGRSAAPPSRHDLELPPETYLEPSPLEVELQEETLALEVLRKQKEREEVERRAAEQQRERERRAEAESAKQQCAQRLEELKSFGRAIACHLPTDAQAAVTADLEAFVTPAHVPASLSDYDARAFIQSRVERHRQRHLARRAAESEARRQRDDRARLIEAGRSRARMETLGWDQESAAEAQAIAADALEDEVEHDWDESRVRCLVDDVLDEYEEDASDDEDDDGGLLE
jgi:excisionase family DNA binding protein